MNVPFDKIYCINYVENLERREFMQFQFKRLGIIDKVEFFNFLDLSKFSIDILNSFNKYINSIPVLGCALAHYSCVKQAKLLGYNKILILEDDICFLRDIKILEDYLNDLPEDWEYIKYVYPCHISPDTAQNFFKINKLDKLKYISFKYIGDKTCCAGAYALQGKGIDLYINLMESNKLFPADLLPFFYSDFIKSPINSYFCTKNLMLPELYLRDENIFTNIENIRYFGTPIIKVDDKNDFYLPEKSFVSLIRNDR